MQKLKEFVKSSPLVYKAYYYIASFLVNLLKVFLKPEEHLVLFLSYGGKHYSDSPRNIYEKMIQDERYNDYEFVWAFVNPADFQLPGNARKVKLDTLDYYKVALKARVWVTNVIIERALNFKGKNTFYVCTNHGIPLKEKSGTEKVFTTLSKYRYDSLLAQSQFEAELDKVEFKVSDDVIDIVGLPRNDLLAENPDGIKEKVRAEFNIPEDKKILLYAPTYRDWEKGTRKININVEKWEQALGTEYVLLYRAHPTIKFDFDSTKSHFCKNATKYESMDKLMLATDLFISDYSSSFFDFSILGKPMLCWAYDYEEFSKYRHLRVDIVDEVYGGAVSEDDLLNIINNLPIDEVLAKTKAFQEKYVTAYGNASEKALDIIWNNICEE